MAASRKPRKAVASKRDPVARAFSAYQSIPNEWRKAIAEIVAMEQVEGRKVSPTKLYAKVAADEKQRADEIERKRAQEQAEEAALRARNAIQKVSDLGKDGPISDDVRRMLDLTLDEVQIICLTLRKLCDEGLGENGWDVAQFQTVVDSMAYRAGRLLNPWTNTGYFADEEEACHG